MQKAGWFFCGWLMAMITMVVGAGDIRWGTVGKYLDDNGKDLMTEDKAETFCLKNDGGITISKWAVAGVAEPGLDDLVDAATGQAWLENYKKDREADPNKMPPSLKAVAKATGKWINALCDATGQTGTKKTAAEWKAAIKAEL